MLVKPFGEPIPSVPIESSLISLICSRLISLFLVLMHLMILNWGSCSGDMIYSIVEGWPSST
jgi:hypothetical protein